MGVDRFSSWEDAVSWLIGQPGQIELVRACYFDRPAYSAALRFSESDEWQAVRELLPANGRLALDVGAGMGIASFALAADGWQVTSLEPDPSDLVGAGAIRKLAHEANVDIQVVEQWGESLPFEDATFDLIHARQVLHHASNLEQFLKELLRVLKPGGRLVATREHVISNSEQLSKFLANHPLHNIYGGENAYRKRKYVAAIEGAGFVMREIFGPWDSVINLSPFSRDRLRELFLNRFGHLIGASWVAKLAFSSAGFRLARRVFGLLDHRPGRLYTFVADRPMRNI